MFCPNLFFRIVRLLELPFMHLVPFNRLRVSNKIMQNVRFRSQGCQNHEVEQEKLQRSISMVADMMEAAHLLEQRINFSQLQAKEKDTYNRLLWCVVQTINDSLAYLIEDVQTNNTGAGNQVKLFTLWTRIQTHFEPDTHIT